MLDYIEKDSDLLDKKTNCFKKHLVAIIILCSVIAIVALVLILVFTLKKDETDNNTDKSEKKDDKEAIKYEYGLEIEELRRRTDRKNLMIIHLLTPNSEEYKNLAEGDKEALKYLVKAGAILEDIELRIDEINNIPFRNFLEEELKNEANKEKANLTKVLFLGQKGINAQDYLAGKINLAKGIKQKPGLGVFPSDITKEELHSILIKMLKKNKTEEVKKILNQRSIVERDGEYLKATDYVDFFKEDFKKIADLLIKASTVSTNVDFNQYLILQAEAFREANPLLDAYADIKWASLQDTPLELTIVRENYVEELTPTFNENEELKELLKKNNIFPVAKDSLGFRLGIVNKNGTNQILSIKKYLKEMAENMPYNNEYNQSISSNDTEVKQAMVDVDLILCAGYVGAFRGGVVLAENLPNDDKLSLTLGGGRRNVYHRQMRKSDPEMTKLLLDAVLDPEQHEFYSSEANHLFTICHENTHSLGPIITDDKLGQYSHIIEENKADMGGLIFLDLLQEKGYYTELQKKQIIVTFIVDSFMREKPNLNQPHWVRSVMQNYYQFKNGGYEIKNEKIHVNIDKVVGIGKEMMKEIIRIQLDNNITKAEEYINNNFIWNEEMKLIGGKKLAVRSVLNGILINELADKLLEEK